MTPDKRVEEIAIKIANAIDTKGTDEACEIILETLTQYHQDIMSEVIEIIESVQVTAQKMGADDTRPEKAKMINDWLMPEVKRNIIEAIKAQTIINLSK